MNSEQDLNHLLNDFVARVPHVTNIVAVSNGGMLIACDEALATEQAERLAAIASGLVSLLSGAARSMRSDPVNSNLTQTQNGFMFSMSVAGGASLLALAERGCSIGQVGQELAKLINQVEPDLVPRNQLGDFPSMH